MDENVAVETNEEVKPDRVEAILPGVPRAVQAASKPLTMWDIAWGVFFGLAFFTIAAAILDVFYRVLNGAS